MMDVRELEALIDRRVARRVRRTYLRLGLLVALAAGLFWSAPLLAQLLNYPGDFSDGEVISASGISTRFSALYDGHNDQEARVEALERRGIAIVRDRRPDGTQGGVAPQGSSWLQRPLSGEVEGYQADFVAVANNTFTLQPGTYHLDVAASMWVPGWNRLRVYSIAEGKTVALGLNARAYDDVWGGYDAARLNAVFTVAGAPETFRIDHWRENAPSVSGDLGAAIVEDTNDDEIYLEMVIVRFE